LQKLGKNEAEFELQASYLKVEEQINDLIKVSEHHLLCNSLKSHSYHLIDLSTKQTIHLASGLSKALSLALCHNFSFVEKPFVFCLEEFAICVLDIQTRAIHKIADTHSPTLLN